MQVVVYTDSAGIGGAEISLSHLVANVSDKIEVTVMGRSELVVEAIAQGRSQATKLVLPNNSLLTHLAALLRLRPDVVHINLCTPWAGATGLAAALMLPSESCGSINYRYGQQIYSLGGGREYFRYELTLMLL